MSLTKRSLNKLNYLFKNKPVSLQNDLPATLLNSVIKSKVSVCAITYTCDKYIVCISYELQSVSSWEALTIYKPGHKYYYPSGR